MSILKRVRETTSVSVSFTAPGKAELRPADEAVALEITANLVVVPSTGAAGDSIDDAGEIALDVAHFGFYGIARDLRPNLPGNVSGLLLPGAVGRVFRGQAREPQIEVTLRAHVFYDALERNTELKELGEDLFANEYETFRGRFEGGLRPSSAGEPIFDGVLVLDYEEGGLGWIEQIRVPLSGVLLRLHGAGVPKGTADCDLRTLKRTLTVQPIGFRSSENDRTHSASSARDQGDVAKSIWKKCCIELDVRAAKIIVDPDRRSRLPPSQVADPADFDGAIRVYFIDRDVGRGGGQTWQHGMANARVVMTNANRGNPYLLAHEIGHVLKGHHPDEEVPGLWEGEKNTVLEPSCSPQSPGNPRNTRSNCCQATNGGLDVGRESCTMDPDR